MKLLLVGGFASWPGSLESSYTQAFKHVGCEVEQFDMAMAVDGSCRFGRAGRIFNRFVAIEVWNRKANRQLVVRCQERMPDVLVVFGKSPVQAGALAQLAIATNAQTVFIWPDTLLNLTRSVLECLPLYDLVASYSQTAVEKFRQLGAKRVAWIPLAADPWLHACPTLGTDDVSHYGCDVSFIGNWRPEREEILSRVGSQSDVRLKIWGGPDWLRFAKKNPITRRAWQGEALFSDRFARAARCSKINLNIIDTTNRPAANMRLFEVLVAGGLQVASTCPEMEQDLRHGEHLFYYRDTEELLALIRRLLRDDELRGSVASAGYAKVMADHTYAHRVRTILGALNLPSQWAVPDLYDTSRPRSEVPEPVPTVGIQ